MPDRFKYSEVRQSSMREVENAANMFYYTEE